MKKKSYYLPFVWIGIAAIVAMITCFLHFPATLRSIEANGFFTCTPYFIYTHLSQPAGVTLLLADFINQFYGQALRASLLQMSLIALSGCCAYGILKSIATTRYTNLSLIVFTLCAITALNNTVLALMFFFTFFPLYLFLKIKSAGPRHFICHILFLILFFFVQESFLLLFYIQLMVLEVFYHHNRKGLFFLGAGFLLAALLPLIWSAQVRFIPHTERYTLNVNGLLDLRIYLALVSPLTLAFLSKYLPTLKAPLFNTTLGIACLIATYWMIHRSAIANKKNEIRCALELFAEEGNWNKVKQLAIKAGAYSGSETLPYALLAESELGTLPHHLLLYPIYSSDQFLFRHQYAPFCSFFNGLFYQSLGVADEVFHQNFETGTQSKHGISFRSLRHITDAAIQTGDTTLARKYLTILGTTNGHSQWIAQRKERLQQPQHRDKRDTKLLRSDIFIGALAFEAELVLLLQKESNHIKRMDYLCCSMLLNKKPERFLQLMLLNKIYWNKPLPPIYAEALAMLYAHVPGMPEQFHIPQETLDNWSFFSQMRAENRLDELMQNYRDSYWYYYFYSDNRNAL